MKQPLMAKNKETYLAVVFFVAKKMANPVATRGPAMHRKTPRFLTRMERYGTCTRAHTLRQFVVGAVSYQTDSQSR